MGKVPQPDVLKSQEKGPAFQDCATTLITRWEVTSPATYKKRWSHVYYPGGASGPTWGLGWDGGHQTKVDNARAWREHPDVMRLAQTSGVQGDAARRRIKEWYGINTSFDYATAVFAQQSLPSYTATTRRAFGAEKFDNFPVGVQCALVSLVYNRGGQMTGSRRSEMRHIRDVCEDKKCVADQLLGMRRLWPDVPGLQNRRADEARVAQI